MCIEMEWAQGVYNTGASIDVFCVLRYCSIPNPPHPLFIRFITTWGFTPHPWLEERPGVAAMLAWPTLIPTTTTMAG